MEHSYSSYSMMQEFDKHLSPVDPISLKESCTSQELCGLVIQLKKKGQDKNLYCTSLMILGNINA